MRFVREHDGAIDVDDGLDQTGLTAIPAIAFGRGESVGRSEQRDQRAARGSADRADPGWIDVMLAGVRPQPPNGGLQIVQGRREPAGGAESIRHRHHHVVAQGELRAKGRSIVRSPKKPAVAVDEDDRRKPFRARGATKVELKSDAGGLAVGKAFVRHDSWYRRVGYPHGLGMRAL